MNSEAQSFILQHSNLNRGNLASSHGSLIVDNLGNLKLNAPSSSAISFTINNVEQFNDSEIKNLVDNISISSAINLNDQAAAITANTAELTNILIGADVMNYSSGRIGKVTGTSGFSFMNSNLNGGVISDAFAAFKQANSGRTIINAPTGNFISFRKNDVEQFRSTDLDNLTTALTVSGSKVNVAIGTGFSIYLNEIACLGSSGAFPANATLMMTTKQGSLPGYSSNYYPTLKTN